MYRPKRDVLASIKERSVTKGGKHYTIFLAFLGIDPIKKSKVRVARSDRKELVDYINAFYKRLGNGDAVVQLSNSEAIDARTALDLIAQHELGMSLVDCVRAYLDGSKRTLAVGAANLTLQEAWDRYFNSLAGRSYDYRKTMKYRVGVWVSKTNPDTPLSSVTAAGVKDYLMANVYRASDPKTAKTYNNVLGDIHTFIRWCAAKEQSLLASDPLDGMKRMEIGYRQPEYVKAADAAKFFRALEAHKDDAPADLADAILSFFCGMRAAEIDRVREGEEAVKISLEDHFIRIIKVKGSLRGVRPRAFRIPEQAEAWMRSFDFMSAVKLPNKSYYDHWKARAKEAGVTLPKNPGRHTFITMYEAAHHDANALSAIVGNTEGVRSRSYNGVELEREGKAYFEIMPGKAQ